ncbi:MAG: methenyltetrahydromethanopterin cyclohydrolase [Promethearchaeota archaeon]
MNQKQNQDQNKYHSPSVNQKAETFIHSFNDKCDFLGIKSGVLSNGARIFDFTNASLEGSIHLARVCMADLSVITTSPIKGIIDAKSGPVELEIIEVETKFPIIACMASQYAGWNVKVKKINESGEKKTHFKSMGSGPARALALKEKKLFEEINYKDNYTSAVIVLETSKKPDELVAEYVAKKCGVKPENVYILFAPTSSLAGSVQIAARIVETSLHKFLELGLNPDWVVSGKGTCPVAPVADDDFKAMGWTNDCIIFTGKVTLNMSIPQADEHKLIELIKKCPSNTSSSYGKPFLEVFKEAGGDFFKIDPGMFAPAQITVINSKTGNTFTEGELNQCVLDFS